MIVCLIIYGLFSILLLGIASILPVHSCVLSVFFYVKEIGKKEKHPECGDWDINGGQG